MQFRDSGATRRKTWRNLRIGLASAIVLVPATMLGMRAVYSLSISPGSLNVGESSTGTVVLDRTVRTATGVSLTASPQGIVTVPATVTVAARTTSAKFSITANSAGCVSIRATEGDRSKAATLSVHSISPQVALSTDKDGSMLPATFKGTVRITPPRGTIAPRLGYSVSLSSSAANVASVPSSVLVLSGQSSATFAIRGTGYGCAVITAAFGGGTSRRALQIYPDG